ncbi:F-box protein [Corchorus olitorius]|uniref:F-box protein n=1 Tax=Corchorus olitorius TaxID=93759 RepID=A0A1R3H143_9ROSI|nr:F-box protein [Corchorus olitorius]
MGLFPLQTSHSSPERSFLRSRYLTIGWTLPQVHEMNVNLNLKLLGYSVCNLVPIPKYE